MLRYTSFLFSIVVKKKGLYISFLLLCMTFFFLFYASISKINSLPVPSQGLFPIDTFIKWFPFVFSTIFSSLLIIIVFKSGEENGIELLLSAKPIKRKEIIFSKFLVMYIVICIFHIFLFLFYMGITQIDKYATTSQKLKYSISITIGGLIVTFIMASIIVIISSFIGKVGTIISGILFAAVTPILSFTVIPLSSAPSPTEHGLIVTVESDIKPRHFLATTRKSSKDIYDPSEQKKNGKGITFLGQRDAKIIQDNKNTWYRYAKYVDFWYQIERFYSLFEPTTNAKSLFSFGIKHASYNELDSQTFASIKAKAQNVSIKFYTDPSNVTDYQEFIGSFSKDEIEYERKHLTINDNKYIGLTKLNGSLPTSIKHINDQIKISKNKTKNKNITIAKKMQLIRDQLKIDFGVAHATPFKYYRILLWRAISDYQINNPTSAKKAISLNLNQYVWLTNILLQENLESKQQAAFNINSLDYKDKDGNFSYDKFSKQYLLISDYEENKYLGTSLITIIWGTLAVILIIISVVVYLGKDFK